MASRISRADNIEATLVMYNIMIWYPNLGVSQKKLRYKINQTYKNAWCKKCMVIDLLDC